MWRESGTDEGDEEPLFSAHCERTADGLQRFAERPLLFEPGTRYRYSTYGWILVSAAVEAAANEPFFTFHGHADLQAAGHARYDARLRDRTDPGSGDLLLPEIQWQIRAMARSWRGAATIPASLEPARSCPRRPTWCASAMAINSGKLLQPATVKMLQTPQQLASGEETGYGLGWDLETVSLAGASTTMVGHDGEYFVGGSTSFMTFPERGLVVAVTTNTSFADTSSVALKIAQAFAETAKSPARK